MEVKTLVYDAFSIVLGNGDVLLLITVFILIVTILITIIDIFEK